MGKDSGRDTNRQRGSPETSVLWGLLRLIRRINETVIILIFATLCLVVFAQVIARFLFHSPFSWSEELARYLQVWLVLLGAAACMQRGQHIAIDFLANLMPPPLARGLAVLMNLIIVGYMLVVLRFSADLMEVTSYQTSPAMQIPMSAVYLSIPVSGSLLLVESVITLVRRLRGQDPFERVVREEVR